MWSAGQFFATIWHPELMISRTRIPFAGVSWEKSLGESALFE